MTQPKHLSSDVFEKTLEQMIQLQKKKVMQVAEDLVPNITPEDLRNPQDFPTLYQDALFNYEDGILTGYLSVQVALRNKFNEI